LLRFIHSLKSRNSEAAVAHNPAEEAESALSAFIRVPYLALYDSC
jgi:hypothetical protein